MFKSLGAAGLLVAICTASAWADDEGEKKKLGGLAKDPEAVFKKLDANGDGKLSKDEFKKLADHFRKVEGKGEQILERLFDMLDENKDGSLSLEEFKKIRELREKLKGKIDPEKLKGLREKLKDRKGDGEKPAEKSEKETGPKPREKP